MISKLLIIFVILTFTRSSSHSNLAFLEDVREETGSNSIRCFWMESKSLRVFDLKNLKKPLHQDYDYNFTVGNKTVLYNFCDNTMNQCEGHLTQFSYTEKEKKCIRIANSIKFSNEWSLINETNPDYGVYVKLNHGEVCKSDPVSNTTINYTITLKMLCNPYMSPKKLNITNREKFDFNSCHNELEMETKEACPTNLYVIWSFLKQYSSFFGAFLILIGIFEVFLGVKIMVVTIFIVTCAISTTFIFVIMFQFFIPSDAHPAIIWVVLGISLVIGFVLGFFISKYKNLLLGSTLGGYMGYIMGIFFYNLGLSRIDSNPMVIYLLTIIISIIIGCLLGYFLFKHILIFSTSFCGAYAFIRGISLYAGNFPDENYIIDLIRNDEMDALKKELTLAVYAYIAGWIILFILGVIVQYKINKENKENDDENEDYKFYIHKNK